MGLHNPEPSFSSAFLGFISGIKHLFYPLRFPWMHPSEKRFELEVGEWAPAAFRLILHGSGQCSVLFDWLHRIPFPVEPCRPSSWRGKHLLHSCKSASLGLVAKWRTMMCGGGISNRACANLFISSRNMPPCSPDPKQLRPLDRYCCRIPKSFQPQYCGKKLTVVVRHIRTMQKKPCTIFWDCNQLDFQG